MELVNQAAKMEALTFLSRPRRVYPQFPDSNVAYLLTPEQLADRPALDAAREDQARKLSAMVEQWEKARNSGAQARPRQKRAAFRGLAPIGGPA